MVLESNIDELFGRNRLLQINYIHLSETYGQSWSTEVLYLGMIIRYTKLKDHVNITTVVLEQLTKPILERKAIIYQKYLDFLVRLY